MESHSGAYVNIEDVKGCTLCCEGLTEALVGGYLMIASDRFPSIIAVENLCRDVEGRKELSFLKHHLPIEATLKMENEK